MRVGLLFPGEMGGEIGAACKGEIMWASEGRSDATTRRAQGAGFEDASTVADLARRSDIVMSICPPAIAEETAIEICRRGFRGLFLEANAISTKRMARIEERLIESGCRVVDGAIIARTSTNLYLAGAEDDTRTIANLFAGSAVNATSVSDGIGAASALKMAFGGWNKIGIALTAQAHALARVYGVEEALTAEGVSPERLPKAGARAWRWGPEMREVAETCAAVGLPDGLPLGAGEIFGRWAKHRDDDVELGSLLEELRDE